MVSLDEPDAEQAARIARLVSGYREAAWRALALAHRYRDEEGAAGGDREKACITQALSWRSAARDVRAGRPVAMIPRPGLARARVAPTTRSRRAAG